MERNLTNGMNVEKPLITIQTSLDIRKFIQERSSVYVISATKSSVIIQALKKKKIIQALQLIRGFIQGRSRMPVVNVKKPSAGTHSSLGIRGSIQGISTMDAVNVGLSSTGRRSS